MSDNTKIESDDRERVRKALDDLGEHFDAVHIFASRHESGSLHGTVFVNMGTGNWFTRYGHVREWVIYEEEATRVDARNKQDDRND